MVVVVENPNACTKKEKKMPLELVSEFSEVSRYKVSVQKSTVFLHTSNEQLRFEI